MNLEELDKLPVKGFLAPEEGRRLHELASRAARLGPVLEIGSYCGKSTLYLGSACREAGSVLFSLDHHQGNEEQQPGQGYHDPDLYDPETGTLNTLPHFRRTLRMAGLEDTVAAMVAGSEVAARQWATPLSMVFIDGGHSFTAAVTDYSLWSTHVMPGGILAIHDIFFDPAEGGQAPRTIYGMALASGLFEELPMVGTLGALRRHQGARTWEE
ncbi:MAG: class I SAM-dependent methyltransferase [Desulfatibacillaceae bacterium]